MNNWAGHSLNTCGPSKCGNGLGEEGLSGHWPNKQTSQGILKKLVYINFNKKCPQQYTKCSIAVANTNYLVTRNSKKGSFHAYCYTS